MKTEHCQELVEKVMRACVDHPDFRVALMEALVRPQVTLVDVLAHIERIRQ